MMGFLDVSEAFMMWSEPYSVVHLTPVNILAQSIRGRFPRSKRAEKDVTEVDICKFF